MRFILCITHLLRIIVEYLLAVKPVAAVKGAAQRCKGVRAIESSEYANMTNSQIKVQPEGIQYSRPRCPRSLLEDSASDWYVS